MGFELRREVSHHREQRVAGVRLHAGQGHQFAQWTGDTTGIADLYDPTTTITMPNADATITATYAEEGTYTLTVVDGALTLQRGRLDPEVLLKVLGSLKGRTES